MSNLIILFLAVIAVIETVPAQSLDLNKILELIQQQRLNSGSSKQGRIQLRQEPIEADSDSDDDSLSESDDDDDSDNNRLERLRKQSIIDLIEKVANEKNDRHRNNDRNSYLSEKSTLAPILLGSNSDKRENSDGANNLQKDILDKLFSKSLIEEERKAKQKVGYPKQKRLSPALNLNKLNNYKNDALKGLGDYSKIYIVLNPQAAQRSKNKNALNDLISKVLLVSGSSSKMSRPVNKKPRRYKGFVLDDRARRSRSYRKNYRRDSMGDDYGRKRPRNGGNPAGHTSIPYIRHRGDIYERDD
ncbi:hypothetical protein B5X24_HaOG209390 [Helicoverpa armigera]|uniref:Uncharacterized protein n=1 Tax=Helicoverpa armigera TaxID=29058 RepID=A0A2W1BH16_HELAM|nr:hypothetical protein B5X24_HaOG209390 [Helicoverpa armigera]